MIACPYVQALNSLLIPAAPQLAGHEEEVAGLQRTVLSSQCIGVLLNALQAAEAACQKTNGDAAVMHRQCGAGMCTRYMTSGKSSYRIT